MDKPIKAGELHPSWKAHLGEELNSPYMKTLKNFLKMRKQQGQTIFPPGSMIFNAFNTTWFENVSVVIIGQDPYHGDGQAHGLSFSVPKGVRPPPSLKNIFKEIEQEFGQACSGSGDLTSWANQGVLMLNAVLTVERGNAGAHQNQGWEHFTDQAISKLNEHRENLVFMLWGSYAHKKGQYIDKQKHLVLSSPHPSPFSAHRGFLGNGHFIKANEYLKAQGKPEIQWVI